MSKSMTRDKLYDLKLFENRNFLTKLSYP